MKLKSRGVPVLIVLGVAMLMLSFAAAAFAQDDTNLLIVGGANTITTPLVADFSSIQLDGTAKSVDSNMAPFTVVDARGTGAGWNVTVQASQFKQYASDYVDGGKLLPASSLSMVAPTVAKGTDSSNTVPTLTSGSYTIDNGAVQIASAALDAGMGTYIFTPQTMTLSVDADAYAATYRSDVTVSVTSGPGPAQ